MNTNLTPKLGTSRRFLSAISLFVGLLLAPLAFAQIVSSGLTGIVSDKGGKPVAGATVTATHSPTGTTYTATTSVEGRYNFRGMLPGGPYNVGVTAAGFQGGRSQRSKHRPRPKHQRRLRIGIRLRGHHLEKFMVAAGTNELDGSASGAGYT